jgi:hypothetical protein
VWIIICSAYLKSLVSRYEKQLVEFMYHSGDNGGLGRVKNGSIGRDGLGGRAFRGLGTGQKTSPVENWFCSRTGERASRARVCDTECAWCIHFEGRRPVLVVRYS